VKIPVATMLAAFASASYAASVDVRGFKEFNWQKVATEPTGELYFVDPDEIDDVVYFNQPMKKAPITIHNFRGRTGTNRLFSTVYASCERLSYNVEFAVAYMNGEETGVAMPEWGQNEFKTPERGTGMASVIQKICED
jgi:hypothetical protein